jgi:hypothetical protein
MHSDVSLFYSYTVVSETHFVIVTVPLIPGNLVRSKSFSLVGDVSIVS